jgi:hypothetical protein
LKLDILRHLKSREGKRLYSAVMGKKIINVLWLQPFLYPSASLKRILALSAQEPQVL